MILVSLLANRWLMGSVGTSNVLSGTRKCLTSKNSLAASNFTYFLLETLLDTAQDMGTKVMDGEVGELLNENVGLFLYCKVS